MWRALEIMRQSGAALRLTHGRRDGDTWTLTNGIKVSTEAARLLINHPNIIDCGGALFRNLPGQVFHFAEEESRS
jgi:hypothetical protein